MGEVEGTRLTFCPTATFVDRAESAGERFEARRVSSWLDNQPRSLVDTVHHRLEGLGAEEFVGRLPCAATPSVIVNDKHAVRDEPMIEMHQLVQR